MAKTHQDELNHHSRFERFVPRPRSSRLVRDRFAIRDRATLPHEISDADVHARVLWGATVSLIIKACSATETRVGNVASRVSVTAVAKGGGGIA
jgi:hypothetical protein